ncbi:hypothetical protein X801_07969, partial [Opisthorchis viverrini]
TWRNALRRRTRPVEAYVNLYKHYRLEFNKNLCHPSGFIRGTVATIDTDVASRAVLEQGLHWFQLPQLHPVFLKVDSHQFGYVKLIDLSRFYQEPRWALKEFFGTFYLIVPCFIKGSRVVFSKNEFVSALGQLMSSDEYVDFSEFQAFYEGLSIALAGCPLDSLTDSDDMETYAAIFGSYGMAYKEEMDRYERLVRGSWGV